MKKYSLFNSFTLFILLFLFLFLVPEFSGACPLCEGGAKAETRTAYRGITLLLALMPVLGCIGIFRWLYLKQKNFKEK